MITLGTKIGNIEITELENEVIKRIKEGDDFDGYPSNSLANIVYGDLTANVIRGVIASLVKKEIVYIGEFPNRMVCYHYVADGQR